MTENDIRYLIIPCRGRMEESLALAAKYNAGFEFNDFFSPDILESPCDTENLIEFFNSKPLPTYNTLHGAFFDITVFSYDVRIRRVSDLRIHQSLDIARRIKNVGAVVFHSNINPQISSQPYTDNWLSRNIEYWSGILEEYKDINIYIENMFDDSPESLARLSDALCRYSNYGVCFDYAHASLSGTSPEVWSRALSCRIKHVHINDNDLKSDLHLALGTGKIDWMRFDKLRNDCFAASPVLIETTLIENQRTSFELLDRLGIL